MYPPKFSQIKFEILKNFVLNDVIEYVIKKYYPLYNFEREVNLHDAFTENNVYCLHDLVYNKINNLLYLHFWIKHSLNKVYYCYNLKTKKLQYINDVLYSLHIDEFTNDYVMYRSDYYKNNVKLSLIKNSNILPNNIICKLDRSIKDYVCFDEKNIYTLERKELYPEKCAPSIHPYFTTINSESKRECFIHIDNFQKTRHNTINTGKILSGIEYSYLHVSQLYIYLRIHGRQRTITIYDKQTFKIINEYNFEHYLIINNNLVYSPKEFKKGINARSIYNEILIFNAITNKYIESIIPQYEFNRMFISNNTLFTINDESHILKMYSLNL